MFVIYVLSASVNRFVEFIVIKNTKSYVSVVVTNIYGNCNPHCAIILRGFYVLVNSYHVHYEHHLSSVM